MGVLLLQAWWLAAPVIVAGILHMVVVKKDLWPSLRRPIDGGRAFRGKPLFGPKKTWRGFLFMAGAAAALGVLQGAALGPWATERGVPSVDTARVGSVAGSGRLAHAVGYAIVNAVLGLGYALGELPNSFLKRRLDVAPGKTRSGAVGRALFVIDQADSVVTPLLLAQLFFRCGWGVVAAGSASLTALHLLLNWALYKGNVRRDL